MEVLKPGKKQTRFAQKRYDAMSVIYDLMEWPVEQLWFKKWRRMLWNQVKGPKVLEIGVGTGKNISYYPDNIHVTAIDLSPGMLKRSKKKSAGNNANVTLREMDAQDLDFPSENFDEVAATFAFCSIPDPVLGLKEALRVTKPGGRLYLLEHMLSRNLYFASIMKILDTPIYYLMADHIARETVRNVEAAGWKTEQVRDLTSGGIVRMIKSVNPS